MWSFILLMLLVYFVALGVGWLIWNSSDNSA